MKKLHTTLVVLALAGAAGLAWWLQNKPSRPAEAMAQTGGAAPAGAPGPRGPGAAGAVGAGGAGGGPGGPAAVEVGKVEQMRLEDDAQAVGSLRSRQGVMLRPETAGRIARLAFADGQRVRKGQLLVQLDDTLQRAQLRQAEAQAGIARTNLQRNRELLAQAFISQSAVDQSAANLQVAEAQVALAQATMQRMRIVAPFDAVAGIRTVNQGDYVKDGADLVNLEDLSSMWIDFRLPERYLDRLKAGQPVEVSVDALPGRSFAARVGALDSQLEANGRSVLVRAELKDGAGSLRPGMFARARIVFGVRDKALVVPEEALVPVAGKQVLYRVVPGAQGGWQAQRLDARIGLRVPGKVEVLSGLQPGDRVVVGGQARLARGDNLPVRVVDIDRPAGPPDGAASRPAAAASGAASGVAPAVRNGAPA